MLSGETAMGKYPVKAVQTMANLAAHAEASLAEYGYLQKIKPDLSNRVTDAVSVAAIGMVDRLGAKAIFSLTETGFSARQISRHRPECPIFAVTMSDLTARKLAMNWGVIPLLHLGDQNDESKISCGIKRARSEGYLKTGDIALIVAGQHETTGGTDYIRVFTLKEH